MKIEVKFDSNDNVEVRDFLNSLKSLLYLLRDTHNNDVIESLHEQSKFCLEIVIDAFIKALDNLNQIIEIPEKEDSYESEPVRRMAEWLIRTWTEADDKHRVWLEKQFVKAFPDFAAEERERRN